MNIIAPDFSRKPPRLDFSMLNPRKGQGMERLFIAGGVALRGRVAAMGSKNASLPQMVAAILTDQPLLLAGLPALADMETMAQLLAMMGVDINTEQFATQKKLTLTAADIGNPFAPYDLVRKMRASIFVLGPLLARAGRARVSLPGGCAIGARPVDLHIHGLEQLGAKIEVSEGYVVASADNGLTGATINFPQVSVGATENIMMAATLARGRTVLGGAACEPEIIDLGALLIKMGARIEGLGTSLIVIDGVEKLHGAEHRVIPDRIEVGSLLLAGVASAAHGSAEVTVAGARPDHLQALMDIMQQLGAKVTVAGDNMTVAAAGKPRAIPFVKTAPYPDFPTDLQAQLMAVLAMADGQAVIEEAIFENRYMHVPELIRLGAAITLEGNRATIDGVDALTPAPVMATDLRASMSLVIAGLAANSGDKEGGETVISRLYHLDRGYDGLEEKLSQLGAAIARRP